MRMAVAAERQPGETRVALVPELVPRLLRLGAAVVLEPGAGVAAGFTDQTYVEAGASIDETALGTANVVLSVQPLDPSVIGQLRPGTATISFSAPAQTTHQVQAFAMDRLPRISRAQSMDVLTSQALVIGYRAVVVAADLYPRFFGLCVTAAGTVPPAEVLVLGAGVAGLQAIATARRLGAAVSGYDVRSSSAEEIASLGATPIELDLPALEGAAGYAREMTAERAAMQYQLLAPYVARADVVITTAAVPGRPAPMLVTTRMLEAMKPGSVVVDVAADVGGNVEGARPGEQLQVGPALLWGGANVPASMPTMASQLYAQNVVNFLELLVRPGTDRFAPNLHDEIVAATLVR